MLLSPPTLFIYKCTKPRSESEILSAFNYSWSILFTFFKYGIFFKSSSLAIS